MLDKVELLLNTLDLDEVFDVLDITPYEVVKILLREGLVTLPPFLEEFEDGTAEEQEASN
jgi:hypothetical protein